MGRLAYLGPEGIEEEQLLKRLEEEHFPIISLDTETVGIKDRRCIGIGIGLNARESVYFPIMRETSPYLEQVWTLIWRAEKIVFHNAIYDLTVILEWLLTLQALGWNIEGSSWNGHRWGLPGDIRVMAAKTEDTGLMSRVQGLPVGGLADMSHRYEGMEIDEISDILPQRHTMLDLPVEDVAYKCMKDVQATWRLFHRMRGPEWTGKCGLLWEHEPNLQGIGWDPSESLTHYVTPEMQDCYRVDVRMIDLLLRMTVRGIKLRQDKVEDWYLRLSEERLFYEDICNKEGFNPASPQQVGITLAYRGNFLPFTRPKRGQTNHKPSLETSEEVLEQLTDPLAVVILKHRKLSKLIGTYFRPWRGRERGYTHFRQDLSTSRLSSYDRNLQNVPEQARDIFEADSGVWTWMDYDQLEMRILSEIAQEPKMLQAYETGEDIHWLTQQALWPGTDRDDSVVRLRSKTFNYAMSYRAQDHTLAKNTGLVVPVASRFRQAWLDNYSEVDRWQRETIAQGLEDGWVLNMFGRRCRLPGRDMAPQSHIEKCCVNYPMQSTAADIVKRAMLYPGVVDLDQTLQVHDEILVDGIAEFPEALEWVGPLRTTFKVKQGLTWI